MKITIGQLSAKFESSPLFQIYKKVLESTEGLSKPARVALTKEESDLILTLSEQFDIYPPGEMIEGSLGMILSSPEAGPPSTAFRNQTGLAVSFTCGVENYIDLEPCNPLVENLSTSDGIKPGTFYEKKCMFCDDRVHIALEVSHTGAAEMIYCCFPCIGQGLGRARDIQREMHERSGHERVVEIRGLIFESQRYKDFVRMHY